MAIVRYEAEGFKVVTVDEKGNKELHTYCSSLEAAEFLASKLSQDSEESFWQAEEDRIDLERLQDRMDRYVAAFSASKEWAGLDYEQLAKSALSAIRSIDEVAKREVLTAYENPTKTKGKGVERWEE